MPEYWVDYRARKLSGAEMKNAVIGPNGERCTGCIRYIDAPDLLRTKHTNKAEYDDLIANGLKVRLVMQVDTDDADGGWARGVANAQHALAGSQMLGYTGVIFFTNDRPNVIDVKTWQAYLDGAASVLGIARVGAYGFANALNAAKGHASAFWQAGRESDLVPHANYYQWNNGRVYINGVECDRNRVISDYVPGGQLTQDDVTKNDEELHMLASAASDDYISVPANGNTNLFFGVHFGRSVTVKEIWAVYDTPGASGKNVKYIGALGVSADRPGPVNIGEGVRTVSVRYSADHSFTVWTA
jgi:hypothetical protein